MARHSRQDYGFRVHVFQQSIERRCIKGRVFWFKNNVVIGLRKKLLRQCSMEAGARKECATTERMSDLHLPELSFM